jgi:hypothetical protein
VNQDQPAGISAEAKQDGAPPQALVIAADSLPWPRRVGPLAWTALQHLALSSHRTDEGWAVAVGVRDIAAGLGVTKDTAARAISVLLDSGLVSRGRVEVPGGQPRSGYLLHLPSPVRLIDWPIHHEAGRIEPDRSPEFRDTKPGGRRLGGLLQPARPGHGQGAAGTRDNDQVPRQLYHENSRGGPVLVRGQRRREAPATFGDREEMR